MPFQKTVNDKLSFRETLTVDKRDLNMDLTLELQWASLVDTWPMWLHSELWLRELVSARLAVSIISQKLYESAFPHLPLEGAQIKLKTYTGQNIAVTGQFTTKVSYEDQSEDLPVIVVNWAGPALCGRNWLQKLNLNWKQIKHVSTKEMLENAQSIQEVLEMHVEVFTDELGTATILVKPDVPPKFYKNRPFPFDKELEKAVILTPVKYSD